MTNQISFPNSKQDKAMNQEQFNQVVEAILAGKYSWACVLILRFAGYNPLHYIPYRTYNRLIKDNCQVGRNSNHKTEIKDLAHLEVVMGKQAHVQGGSFAFWSEYKPEHSSLKDDWLQIY